MPIKRLLGVFSIFMLCVLLTQFSFAQGKTITGKILDDKGSPVQGATVIIKNSKTGTSTDVNGTFRLNVPASAKTLVVSSVGFTQQEIVIGDKESFDISLVASSTSSNDVVVTGYSTTRKKDLTGAVSQITAKDFTTGNLSSPAELIQGKVPGVVVTVPGGDPNGQITIRLRGQ